MLNLLQEKLQNLLNKNSNKINLISQEFQNVQITDDEDNSFDNLFLILTIFLCTCLLILTYYNHLKRKDLTGRFIELNFLVASSEPINLSEKELKDRIIVLNKFNEIKRKSQKISPFYDFLAQVSEFIKSENLVNISYKVNNNQIKFEFTINSSSTNFEKDFTSFVKSRFPINKFEKSSEIKIPDSQLTQYKFEGVYESRN